MATANPSPTCTQADHRAPGPLAEQAEPEAEPRYSPKQLAKREMWTAILLAGATDKTSYKLAERLIRDWFGEGYDERLKQLQQVTRTGT